MTIIIFSSLFFFFFPSFFSLWDGALFIINLQILPLKFYLNYSIVSIGHNILYKYTLKLFLKLIFLLYYVVLSRIEHSPKSQSRIIWFLIKHLSSRTVLNHSSRSCLVGFLNIQLRCSCVETCQIFSYPASIYIR